MKRHSSLSQVLYCKNGLVVFWYLFYFIFWVFSNYRNKISFFETYYTWKNKFDKMMGYSVMFAFSKILNLFQISLTIVGYLKFMLKVFTLCEKYLVIIVNGLHYDNEKKC